MGWNTKNVGKCLTERVHVEFSNLIKIADRFAMVSQFSTQPKTIEDVSEWISEPKCHTGSFLYADINGKLIEIKSIIDSSD